uniref:cDNA FLJ37035 fis, clone BRACE2011545 n=1 Tax=Homo sapiens TaxID=9606 RepID=Q8N9J6_HUMAN|nr:unnamed protein product [Homo sapiens]
MFTPSESPIQSLASWRALRFWYKRHFISTKWKSIIHIHLLLRHFSLESSSCLSTLGKRTGLIYITDILVMVWRDLWERRPSRGLSEGSFRMQLFWAEDGLHWPPPRRKASRVEKCPLTWLL